MAFEIRRLTPATAEEYVNFFDTTPHSDNIGEHRCYCVCWCGTDAEGEDFSTAEKRRGCALAYVQSGALQGYLAYCNGKVVGWCNANTKADCLRCYSWRHFMGDVPAGEAADGARVKSIFCFAIAPDMRRKGLAKQLLERICLDATRDGFDVVEAYPNKAFVDEAEDFMGPAALFEQSGFTVCCETEQRLVMRKRLKL
jgi:GNAT superfamily N-acetyltransferase